MERHWSVMQQPPRGYDAYYPQQPPSPPSGGMSGCAVAALVVGLLGLCGMGGCGLVFLLAAMSPTAASSATAATETAATSTPTITTPAAPARISFQFHGVLVAPTKASGEPWDRLPFSSSGKAKSEDTDDDSSKPPLGKLLGLARSLASTAGGGYVEVLKEMGPYIANVRQAPDPFGWVCLLDGSLQCVDKALLEKRQDQYEATWSPPRTFDDISADSTIQVHVDDADPSSYESADETEYSSFDSIATVNITADDIAKALALHGKVYHCPVYDQEPQLLYVNFSVAPYRP
jgi:hypothetical protein